MKLEYKRGDKCPCGRSHFRAYEKTKHGLRPKFQSREVFLANQAADLRRQRLKRAQRIAEKRGLRVLHPDVAHEWPSVPDGEYMLAFNDGFFVRASVFTCDPKRSPLRGVWAVYDRKHYLMYEIEAGRCPKSLFEHRDGFKAFIELQGAI